VSDIEDENRYTPTAIWEQRPPAPHPLLIIQTIIQYVENIIMPFIKHTQETLGNDSAALVIMDNFKGQVTDKIDGKLHYSYLLDST